MARAIDEECTFRELCIPGRRGYACDNTEDIKGLSFDNARNTLIEHVRQCIRELQAGSGQIVKDFYIGKTYVKEEEGISLKPQDHFTYTKDGISSRWVKYQNKDYGRNGMVVLTIVTRDAVPQDRQFPHQDDYTHELKKALYDHFIATDPYRWKIANGHRPRGRHILRASQAYALCMAYSLKRESVKDPKVEATLPIERKESSGDESKVEIPVEDSKEAKKIRQHTKEVVRKALGGYKFEKELCTRAVRGYACDETMPIEGLSFDKAKNELIEHVKSCIRKLEAGSGQTVTDRKLEAGSGQTVTRFHIGKIHLKKKQQSGGSDLHVPSDPQDISTYKKRSISNSWVNKRKKDYGRDGMVVLTIVTSDAVPQARRPLHQEDYALELQKALVKYFKATPPYNEKIANKDSPGGSSDLQASPAYALCMAYSFEEESTKEKVKQSTVTPESKAEKSVEDSKEAEIQQLTKQMSRLKPS